MTTKVLVKPVLQCPECGSLLLVKYGVIWSGRKQCQQYRCKSCGRLTIHPINEEGRVD